MIEIELLPLAVVDDDDDDDVDDDDDSPDDEDDEAGVECEADDVVDDDESMSAWLAVNLSVFVYLMSSFSMLKPAGGDDWCI